MECSVCGTKTDARGRELLEHGTALFPISCYEENLLITTVPWHWHDELEVLYVTQGCATVFVGADSFTLAAGEGFFINAGILHSVAKGDAEKSCIRSIVFHPRIVGSGVDSIYWQKYIQPLLSNPALRAVCLNRLQTWHREAIDEIKTAWSICLAEPPGYEFDVRAALSRLLLHLVQNHPQTAERPSEKKLRDNERLKGMLLFIQQNYANPMTVSMIAESVRISESECMRCFRAVMGTSPIQYVKQFRLQKAADSLLTTRDKIIQIGLSCGFQDISYFIKSFKQVYGLTPNAYQKKGAGRECSASAENAKIQVELCTAGKYNEEA